MSTGSDAEFIDYYELLGIDPTAEISEIRKAYIYQAKAHHPDAGGSTDMMKLLNKAYKTLTSSTVKAAYDMRHSIEVGTTVASDYSYRDGRLVKGVEDMTDDEIDDFLDSVISEYDNKPPKGKPGMRQWTLKYFKKS